MKSLLWTVIRVAVILLMLGQAASPTAAAQLAAPPTPPVPAVSQQTIGTEAFTPLKVGALPLDLDYVRTFGEPGLPYPPDGQEAFLNNPAGLAIGPDNEVYATENGGRRLHSYAPDGTPGFTAGTAGQSKEFGNPQDVTLHDGLLWVADWNRILIYSTSGVFQQEISDFDNTARQDRSNRVDCAVGISFDKTGRLYLAQTCGSNNVVVFTVDSTGPKITLTLQAIMGEGQFNNVQAVHVADLNTDGTQEVYVSNDNGLSRCLKNNGNWNCSGFGNGFQGRGLGLNPQDPSHIYVVKNDWNGPAVLICDMNGNCNPFITNPQNNQSQIINDPVDIAFDSDGNAYITDRGDSTIKRFDKPDAYIVFAGTQNVPYATTSSPHYYYNNPAGVAIGADYSVFIVEESGQRLTKLADDGSFVWSFGVPGIPGNDSSHLNWASGNPAVDAQGRIYVPDRNNNRVAVLDTDGISLGFIGNQDNDPRYRFRSPSGVAIGPNGDIYVVDQDFNDVQVYSSDRYYKTRIGFQEDQGSAVDGHFNRPSGIAVKDDLTLFVADQNNYRIQQCTRPSLSSTTWTCATFAGVSGNSYWDNDHLNYPSSIAWDAHAGRLYVVDQNENRVLAFDGTGSLLAVLGGDYGPANNQFSGPRSVAVDNVGNVYVADHDNFRIQKFIPVVSALELAGQTGGQVSQIVKDGSTLYASAGPRLDTYSLTDPRHPVFTGESDLLPREINSLAVSGTTAYVTMGDSGLALLDVTNKSHPTLLSSLPILNPTGVAVRGNRAYVAANCCGWSWSSARLYVVDVSVKTSPSVVNFIEWNGPGLHPNNTSAVVVSGAGDGQYAYLADRNVGVIKIDVTKNPPTEAGHYSYDSSQTTGLVLSADESLAFLADQNFGMLTIHTADMTDFGPSLGKLQTRHNPYQDGDWSPITISRDANTLYLSGSNDGLGIVDVTDPANPSQVHHEGRLGSVTNTVGTGDLMYSARESLGVETIELLRSPDLSFNQVDQSLRPAGSASFAVVQGNLTYTSSWVGGLRILDTSNPAVPQELSATSLETSVNNLAIFTPLSGTVPYAYLVTGHPDKDGLLIANVADPKNPQYVGKTKDLTGPLNAIAVRQASSNDPVYAYVPVSAQWDQNSQQVNIGALHVLDVTNPAAINETKGATSNDINGIVNAVAFHGNFLLASEANVFNNQNQPVSGGGLRVFDVADPSTPQQVASFGGFEGAGLAVLGNRAYLNTWGGGLTIWDISNADPSKWTQIGQYPSLRDSYSMLSLQTIGGKLYLTAGRGNMGMAVLDVTDPANIQLLNETGRLGGWGWSPSQAGHYTLFSSAGGGMYTFWSVPAVKQNIPTTGGSLTSAADGTVYTFAIGALANDVRLRHVAVLPANTPAASKKVGIGHAFVVSASSAANDRPLLTLAGSQTYTLQVTYSPEELRGVSEGSLALYYWDGSAWQKQATTIDPATHTLTAHPNHFSLWSVMGTYAIYLPGVIK
jgi:tripartite motif-containing protein 71